MNRELETGMPNPRLIVLALILAVAGIAFRLFLEVKVPPINETNILLLIGVVVWLVGAFAVRRYAIRRCRERSWSMSQNNEELDWRRAIGAYALVTALVILVIAVAIKLAGK